VLSADTYSPGSGTFTGMVSSGGPAACGSGRGDHLTERRIGDSDCDQRKRLLQLTVNSAPAGGHYTSSTPVTVSWRYESTSGAQGAPGSED
jgi:hypothetical protein